MDKDIKLMEESLNFKKIKKGSIIKGKIISLSKDEVVVNINYFCDGIIKKQELLLDEIEKFYEKDKEIYVYVVSLDDGEGNVLLSEKRANYFKVIEELSEIYKQNKIISVFVKQKLEAGLVCDYKGVSGFIPKSKVSINNSNFEKFLGENLEVKLIDFDESKNRIIFSHRDVEEIKILENRKNFIEKSNPGDKFLGRVESIKDFGIFVNVDGVSGFVHKSEMSYKKKFNVNDLVKVSDEIDVYLLKVDEQNQKIYFTMKDLNFDVFSNYANNFLVGEIYEVVVEKILSSGMIVSLNDELTGFIHISEFPESITNLNKEFSFGDRIKAKILKIDMEDKKISLSYSKVFEEDSSDEYIEDEKLNTFGEIFKDVFSKLKN